MSGPDAASPANGAASKTDTPQNLKESATAEKPARFAFGQRRDGLYFVFQHEGSPPLAALGSGGFDRAQDAAYCCVLLNALDAERRGDNPSDVQRQLLEELRALVALQRETLTKHMPQIEAAVGVMRGETKRPEPNVNDLMIEVARGFGLSDAASRSIGDLKGFCAAAYDMQHVPKACQRPLLMLAVRDMFGAKKGQIARAAAAHMGIEIG